MCDIRPIQETTCIASVGHFLQRVTPAVPAFNLQLLGIRRVMGIDRDSAPRTVPLLGRQRPSFLDDGQVAMIPPPRSQRLPGLTAWANGRRGLMVVPSNQLQPAAGASLCGLATEQPCLQQAISRLESVDFDFPLPVPIHRPATGFVPIANLQASFAVLGTQFGHFLADVTSLARKLFHEARVQS